MNRRSAAAAISFSFALAIVGVCIYGAITNVWSPVVAARARIMERESEVELAPAVAWVNNVLPAIQAEQAIQAAADVKTRHEAIRRVTNFASYAVIGVIGAFAFGVGLAFGGFGVTRAASAIEALRGIRLEPYRILSHNRPVQIGKKVYDRQLAGGALLSLDAEHIPADTSAIEALGVARQFEQMPSAVLADRTIRRMLERRQPQHVVGEIE